MTEKYTRTYYAEHYLSRAGRLGRAAAAEVENILKVHSGSAANSEARPSVLDIGCGAGFLVSSFVDAGCDVEGLDGSVAALAVAQERDPRLVGRLHHHQIGIGSASSLPQGAWDILTVWDVLSYVPDAQDVLRLAQRSLRPGGLLVVKTPNVPTHLKRHAERLPPRLRQFVLYQEHHRFHTERLTAELQDAGFSVQKVEGRKEVRPPLREGLYRGLAVRGMDLWRRLYGPAALVAFARKPFLEQEVEG